MATSMHEKKNTSAGTVTPLAVSVRTTRQLTGLGTTKIYALLADGTLESVKVGDRRLILLTSIKKLLTPPESGVSHLSTEATHA
jgi:excisionase family DNA binding protein